MKCPHIFFLTITWLDVEVVMSVGKGETPREKGLGSHLGTHTFPLYKRRGQNCHTREEGRTMRAKLSHKRRGQNCEGNCYQFAGMHWQIHNFIIPLELNINLNCEQSIFMNYFPLCVISSAQNMLGWCTKLIEETNQEAVESESIIWCLFNVNDAFEWHLRCLTCEKGQKMLGRTAICCLLGSLPSCCLLGSLPSRSA